MTTPLGQALKQCRRSAGVTQRALAERVGVDVSYISKLENGRVPAPAADTIVKIARVLNAAPDELLSMSGKIPSDVIRMLGSKPLALRFFREAARLSLADAEWERLTRTLEELADGGGRRAVGAEPALPGFVGELFWDYGGREPRWPEDRHLVTARILAAGDWRAVTWLRERVDAAQLRAWLTKRRGRGLDPRRLRFWELILDLPRSQVDEWIQAARREPWGRRAGG